MVTTSPLFAICSASIEMCQVEDLECAFMTNGQKCQFTGYAFRPCPKIIKEYYDLHIQAYIQQTELHKLFPNHPKYKNFVPEKKQTYVCTQPWNNDFTPSQFCPYHEARSNYDDKVDAEIKAAVAAAESITFHPFVEISGVVHFSKFRGEVESRSHIMELEKRVERAERWSRSGRSQYFIRISIAIMVRTDS